MWYDVTRGFGRKWKQFFEDLEANAGLQPDLPQHIWLLHHLFLPSVNQDAQEWAEAWNAHDITVAGSTPQSPREMFIFGMLEHGGRGMEQLSGDYADNLALYGVDWETYQDDRLMHHFYHNNPDERDTSFSSTAAPAHLAEVQFDHPISPFLTDDPVEYLDSQLRARVDVQSRDMNVRRLVWEIALETCNNM